MSTSERHQAITTTENQPGEALYTLWYRCWDTCQDPGDPYGRSPDHQCYAVLTYPITKTTAKRIYFRGGTGCIRMDRERNYFIARAEFDGEGCAYHHGVRARLHLSPPEVPTRAKPKTMTELRREMADAHPDRGGNADEFITAHLRYQAAQRAERAR